METLGDFLQHVRKEQMYKGAQIIEVLEKFEVADF